MKTGRPTLEKAKKKNRIVGIRLRDEDRGLLEAAAKTTKKTLSDWIRDVLIEHARNGSL
jgi:uncharacterized protein (DUF1778 family)